MKYIPVLRLNFLYIFTLFLFLFAVLALSAHAAEQKQVFKSPDLPDLPYSAAVRAGDTVYVSGVTGHVRGSPEPVSGGIEAEAKQALSYIEEILEQAGSSLDQAVKCTVLLASLDYFPAMNEAYREFFPEDPPARSTIIVPDLPHNSKVEIECNAIAVD